MDRFFKAVNDSFGQIDVLVSNAGNPSEPPLGEYSFESIVKSLSSNFISSVLCTQAAVPLIKKGGCILYTGSIYGLPFGSSPKLPLYSAGKAAIISYAQAMAERLAPDVRCNIVAPGTTKTPSWDGVPQDYVNTSLGMNLIKDWITAEEIADAFIFLAKSPHITCQTITVDAGWQKKIRP